MNRRDFLYSLPFIASVVYLDIMGLKVSVAVLRPVLSPLFHFFPLVPVVRFGGDPFPLLAVSAVNFLFSRCRVY